MRCRVCFSEPSVSITADVELSVCLYFECDMGDPNVGCAMGGMAADSPGGLPGCCGTDSVALSDHSCSGNFGSPDSGTIFFRVAQAEGDACVPYSADYAF